MSVLFAKLKTAYALGLGNLWRVYWYKLNLKLGTHPVCRLQGAYDLKDDFFYSVEKSDNKRLKPNLQWADQHVYFSWFKQKETAPPQWHYNPFNQYSIEDVKKPWYQLSDFDPQIGDIKTIWEASRFDWVLGFSQAAILGDESSLIKLNIWLKDWCVNNPPYQGSNWKCGQEASIRVMHICIATALIKQYKAPSDALIRFIQLHLQRISPTISYAVAQNNNHGTSEAAALFMGGSFLFSLGDKAALKYQKIGCKWLENRAKRLIADDGTFSQYSINYHRVMLDTYSMVEYWRGLLGLPKFSNTFYRKLSVASHWLLQMTETSTGKTPNLGANDGAKLLPLSDADYGDYRPSVQLATVLFKQKCAYIKAGSWDSPLHWLALDKPSLSVAQANTVFFPQGGYSLLRKNKAFVLLNMPCFNFRPSQSDALHLDLWLEGENLLRDAGTYSYNSGDHFFDHYFSAVESHNTIQFDEQEQMPRLSRFLLGAWLKAEQITSPLKSDTSITTACAYRDDKNHRHHRLVKLFEHRLEVVDTVSGFKQKAILRWRLKPDQWILDQDKKMLSNGSDKIKITSDVDIIRFEILEGWESCYYLQKRSAPVLEVEISKSGQLITEYNFMGIS